VLREFVIRHSLHERPKGEWPQEDGLEMLALVTKLGYSNCSDAPKMTAAALMRVAVEMQKNAPREGGGGGEMSWAEGENRLCGHCGAKITPGHAYKKWDWWKGARRVASGDADDDDVDAHHTIDPLGSGKLQGRLPAVAAADYGVNDQGEQEDVEMRFKEPLRLAGLELTAEEQNVKTSELGSENAWESRVVSGSWCCRNGTLVKPKLPPLPEELIGTYTSMTQMTNAEGEKRHVSFDRVSRVMNNKFCFSALGIEDGSQARRRDTAAASGGPRESGWCKNGVTESGANLAHNAKISGKTYHRVGAGGGVPNALMGTASWYMTEGDDERVSSAVEAGFRGDEVRVIEQAMCALNPLARLIQTFGAGVDPTTPQQHLHIKYTAGAVQQIAAVVSMNDFANYNKRRHVAFFPRGGGFTKLQRSALGLSAGAAVEDGMPYFIDLEHPLYETMQYPLFFPHGTAGWYGPDMEEREGDDRSTAEKEGYMSEKLRGIRHSGKKLSLQRYVRQMMLCEPRLWVLGSLANEYLVDMQSRIEERALLYIRFSPAVQRAPREELCKQVSSGSPGRRVKLPVSYPGSPGDLRLKSQDGLALVRHFGKPTWFITMTCNPDWTEIRRELRKQQTAFSRPDVTNRVFKHKLQLVVAWIRSGELNRTYMSPGDCAPRLHYWIHVIEFQRRGLPHAHIVVRLLPLPDPTKPGQMDACVQAEWPSAPPGASDEELARVVKLQKLLRKSGLIHSCTDKCNPRNRYCRSCRKCCLPLPLTGLSVSRSHSICTYVCMYVCITHTCTHTHKHPHLHAPAKATGYLESAVTATPDPCSQ
jgi:hypothetical protein